MTENLRLNSIEIHDFCRVRAVTITPDGNVVKITGENKQGKSSIINAIEAGLVGRDTIPEKPIRDGAKKATIHFDLGDYTVSRTFVSGDMKLEVKGRNGIPLPAPQKILDEIIGAVSFDPAKFARMKPKEQAAMLAKVLGIDFTELNARYAKEYELRTAANKERTRLQGIVDSKRADLHTFKPSDYVAPIVIDDVLAEQKEAQDIHKTHNDTVIDRDKFIKQEGEYEKVIEDLEERISDARNGLKIVVKNREALQKILDAPGELPDLSVFDLKIRSAGTHNEIVRKFAELATEQRTLSTATKTAEAHDAAVIAIADEKRRIVSEAEMPIEGMKLDEDGIYMGTIPFEQCSSAEQLQIAVGLAMKLNPKLRVLRILNGSLLDKNSHKIIADLAEANDYLVFIEIVGDNADGTGILIEDGLVVGYE